MTSTSPLSPFTAKVMNSGQKAILMLPSRAKNPDMPFGATDVMVFAGIDLDAAVQAVREGILEQRVAVPARGRRLDRLRRRLTR